MREPVVALAKHVTMPPPAPPDAPGPFAFADAARVRGILERAGLRGVTHEPLTGEILLGQTVDEAIAFTSELGPAARVLLEATPAQREAAIAAIREMLGEDPDPDGNPPGLRRLDRDRGALARCSARARSPVCSRCSPPRPAA